MDSKIQGNLERQKIAIRYGEYKSPFGMTDIIMIEESLAGLSFSDDDDKKSASERAAGLWPRAKIVLDSKSAHTYGQFVFDDRILRLDLPFRLLVRGSYFQE